MGSLAMNILSRLGLTKFHAIAIGKSPHYACILTGGATNATEIVAELTVEPPVRSLYITTTGAIFAHTAAGTTADKWSDTGMFCNLTATVAELNKLAGVAAGTTTASKALVVDANKRLDAMCIGALSLGAGAGTTVTATATELNTLAGSGIVAGDVTKLHAVTATAAELNTNAGVSAGTVTAGKTVVVDVNKRADALCIGALSLGAGAGTAVTATAAELNTLAGSGIVAGDVTKLHAVTATAAELNVNAGVTAGTVTASKTLVVDANKALSGLVLSDLKRGAPVAKTTSYTVTTSDTGKVFTTTGAAVAVTFTLPAVASNAGLCYRFINTVGQNMVITAPAGTLVATNNAAATNATYSTASQLIGAACYVVCDGAKWLFFQESSCAVTIS